MKKYLILFVFSLLSIYSFAQELKLYQAPEFYQLFPRDDKDSANVIISGVVDDKTYEGKLTLKVYKDGQIYNQQNYYINDQSFNLSSRISAGLHQYKFELYLDKNGNDQLCFSADSVVCGDAYIITGQSNSHASSSKSTYSSPYCRSFGVKTGYVAYSDDHKKVHWGRATGNCTGLKGIGGWFRTTDYGVGIWGMNLMRLIVERYNVPVCIINGGSGSSSIEQNMLQPEIPSLETSFGRLAYRVNKAGLKDNIKAILWHQGEANTNESYSNYYDNFNTLLKDWERVYGGFTKVYLFQLHQGCGYQYQGELREIQNQIAENYDIVEIMSTVGIPGHGGCHYSHEGYVALSENIFSLVARDFYNEKTERIVTPPKIVWAYYSKDFDGNNAEITLQFDQDLLWQEKQEVNGQDYYLKDQFFFRKQRKSELVTEMVETGGIQGDKVILEIPTAEEYNYITYLPAKCYVNSNEVYEGPWLKGYNNMGALSFDNRTISRQKVVYTQMPADMQLYPRNSENVATAKIKGEVYTMGFDKAICKVYKGNQLLRKIEKKLTYNSNEAGFEFSQTLEAGLWEYRFETGFVRKDGVFIKDRVFDNIVCGDVYLINGQSNSRPARKGAIYKNEFCRSFGLNTSYSAYNPADTIWGLASGNNSRECHVSAWGIRVMAQIVENQKIPVCIINGGSGGSTIEYNLPDEKDRLSMNSTYGRLLYRSEKSGVKNHVKAIIWHQGESDSNDEKYRSYHDKFNTLYKAWKIDYPSIEKVYLFQIHQGCGGERQSEIRETQRRLAQQYSDITVVSTCGLPGHDGCHYSNAGYIQMADWLYPLIATDLYGGKKINAASPDILRAYYSKPGSEITLEFTKKIIWPAEQGNIHKMEDYFYLDGRNHLIEKGIAKGNKIVLTLSSKTVAKTISYLPNHVYENTNECYQGPWIYGKNGYGALSFHRVVIN
jgi:lysophospholipase L1-like esterase